MTQRAYWQASRKTIDVLIFGCIFIGDFGSLHRMPQELVVDHNVCYTWNCWREIANILQTNLFMATVFHQEMDDISGNSHKTVICYLWGFATHYQASWDNYHQLAISASISSVHCLMKQMPLELNLGYKPPLPLDLIADLQQLQPKESANTLQGHKYVGYSMEIMGVTRDVLSDT